MADIVYTSPHPEGWANKPTLTSAINAAAVQTLDDGIAAATAQANAGRSTAVAAYYPVAGPWEGAPMFGYGDSYLANNTNAVQYFFDRIKGRGNPQIWGNYGNNGMLAADSCSYAFGGFTAVRQAAAAYAAAGSTGAGTWSPSALLGGEVIVNLGRNDSRLDGTTTSGGTTAKSRAGFANALDALFRLIRAGAKVENGFLGSYGTTSGNPVVTTPATAGLAVGMQVAGTGIPASTYVGTIVTNVSFRLSSSPTSQVDVNATVTNAAAALSFGGVCTYTGSWSMALLSTSCSSSSVALTTTANDTVSIPITISGAAVPVSLVLLGIDNSANAVNGASYSITVDGGTPITGTTSDQMRKTAHTPPNNNFGQLAVPIGTLAIGAHTIVLKHTGTTGQQLWFDCALVETPTPPTIMAFKLPQLPAGGYAAVGGSWVLDQLYNGLIDTVVARFPSDQSIVAVDPNTASLPDGRVWNSGAMIGNTDGLLTHLSDAGNRFYADIGIAALNSLPYRAGQSRV